MMSGIESSNVHKGFLSGYSVDFFCFCGKYIVMGQFGVTKWLNLTST